MSELSDDTANHLMALWRDRRAKEVQRMYDWEPMRWNLHADPQQRAISLAQFDWTKHPPRVYTWSALCAEVPDCEKVLRMCLLDPDLVRDITRKHPGVADMHGTMADDQKVALVMMVTGFNVFITGSAGVGKSKVVMSGILTLREMFSRAGIDMLVTASTGVAAFNIRGLTLHSRLMLMCADAARYQRALVKKLDTLGAVLVDEISMLSVRDFYRTHLHIMDTMMALDGDALTTKYGVVPFGGRQMILVGDYFQLSDVKRDFSGVDRGDRAQNRNAVEVGEFQRVTPEFKMFDRWGRAFATPLWAQAMGNAVLLEEIQRQSDAQFIRFLSNVRWGEINGRDAMEFVATHSTHYDGVPDSAMFLFSTNDEASNHNALKLAMLPGPDIHFCMMQLARTADDGSGREQLDGELPKHRAEASLRLGARARIWSNYNVSLGISNGTQCELVGLVPVGQASVLNNARQSKPVKIHDSVRAIQEHYKNAVLHYDSARYDYQLMDSSAFSLEWTGDNNTVHLIMKPGDSSVHQVEGIHPLELAPTESTVKKYHRPEGAARGTNLNYAENRQNATRGFCVAVRFYHRPHNEIYILPPVLSTRTEQLHGKTRPLITQVQLPLVPGYASTVHSAQGLTLESVAISLTRMQDPALPYVAMTRATTSQALYFVGEAGLKSVEPDQKVVALSRILRRAKQ